MKPTLTLKQIADAVLDIIPESRCPDTGGFRSQRHNIDSIARRVYCIVAHELTLCTMHEIAIGMNRTNHTSVRHHILRNGLMSKAELLLVKSVKDTLLGTEPEPPKQLTVATDNTHLIRKINSLASRVTALEEQLAASGVEVG